MNSDHAPTAEEQLPPLDEFGCDWEDSAAARIRCYARDKGYCEGTAVDALVTELGQRERQLLAALRENRELRLALSLVCELHGCTSEKCTAAAYHQDATEMFAQLAKKDARIAELEQHSDDLPACYSIYTQTKAQLEAAEAKLESVREMVAYYTEDDDSLLSRIRAIVDGK